MAGTTAGEWEHEKVDKKADEKVALMVGSLEFAKVDKKATGRDYWTDCC